MSDKDVANNREALLEKHLPLLDRLDRVCTTRESFSPFEDSPSTKVHGKEKPAEGKARFNARLNKPFELKQPGTIGQTGAEVSPFTLEPLGITYPKADADVLVEHAQKAVKDWAHFSPDERAAICVEISMRIYDNVFELAQCIMHTAGQGYIQAYAGSGPNALDRGLEAIVYARRAMHSVPSSSQWRRPFGKGGQVALEKRYRIVPRGVALVVCCATFPTWNAFPAIFANLATGNAAIVKTHPKAILPMALCIDIARQTLEEFGASPHLVSLAADVQEAPVTMAYLEHQDVSIIDFTGSQRFGSFIEEQIKGKVIFTETSGVNAVVLESCEDLDEVVLAIAKGLCLFSAQMCTSPQNIYVPKGGIKHKGGHCSVGDFCSLLKEAIDSLAQNQRAAPLLFGAIQAQESIDLLKKLKSSVASSQIVREPLPYQNSEWPKARCATPLLIRINESQKELYNQEHFAPVGFIIEMPSREEALKEASHLAKTCGTISSYLYSNDARFIDEAEEAFAWAGANLTINLTGPMPINFAAAYSDFHVSGLNPAGNARLCDNDFISGRFVVVQSRRPAPAFSETSS